MKCSIINLNNLSHFQKRSCAPSLNQIKILNIFMCSIVITILLSINPTYVIAIFLQTQGNERDKILFILSVSRLT